MLVDFVVKNFGPFKDEAILTMTAQSGSEHPDNYIVTKAAGKVLTSAAIFGPNATGKTYLIEALEYLKRMIIFPALPKAPVYAYNPFRLSRETKNAPTEMNIRFISKNVLYDYHISFNGQRILTEGLLHYPNGKKAEVFNRSMDNIEFGRTARAPASISKMVPPNTTCVLAAAQLNNEICKNVHNWFFDELMIVTTLDEGKILEIFVNRINTDKEFKERAINAMKIADFAIADVQGTIKKRKIQDMPGIPTQMKGLMMMAGNEEMNQTEIFLLHDIEGEGLTPEDKKFPIQLESAGTVRFMSLIGPTLDSLTYGKTLVIDEFGQKIHSKLSRWIVDLFCDSRQNTGGGQLIFNTHSTHLMDQDIFRRDQIYLVNKNEKGESELFSISDFGERKDRVILTSYLDGKYGAIPFIDEGPV
ncbi:MAG: ATP-binding protein [Candidatus Methanoplasma sp.]|jgi:AAA15 family ATPase/GTPase|nr:ATP-binding protein [Candidatus Methanoplasma sp.]